MKLTDLEARIEKARACNVPMVKVHIADLEKLIKVARAAHRYTEWDVTDNFDKLCDALFGVEE